MGLGNIIRNIRDRGVKDILDPEVIKAFSEWREIEKNGLTIEASELISFSEQVIYRLNKCPECVKAKECTHCHCPMPEKALTPLAKCSAGKWPKMMPSEDWEEYKKENSIQIFSVGN